MKGAITKINKKGHLLVEKAKLNVCESIFIEKKEKIIL